MGVATALTGMGDISIETRGKDDGPVRRHFWCDRDSHCQTAGVREG